MSQAKKRLSIAIVLGIAVASLVLVLLWGGNTQDTQTNDQLSSGTFNTNDTVNQGLIIGDKNAPITIVEYSDYKCPECGKFHSGAGKKIRAEYIETGKVKIEFRPYPVWGEEAGKLLAGSYCAQEQGKFTRYYDAMFAYMWENHFKQGDYQKAIDSVFTDQVLQTIFNNIGLDKSAFDICLTDPKTRLAYDTAINKAAPDGIQGTPTFIIGGQKVVGNQPYDVYATLLDIQQ